ncbi:Platelet-activating factor acetylhydrolase [Chionoecetes opilio]|uniref:1-alkyl-2-acetylglycerophosphocholine esterase n=1 Tax=Chionoecetes opilio TaxID=41210 RepID=A0A8J5CLZ7_CHIOP|nr:Platelet-activating factor acetylhydrolase [Chionoecetes opilio]
MADVQRLLNQENRVITEPRPKYPWAPPGEFFKFYPPPSLTFVYCPGSDLFCRALLIATYCLGKMAESHNWTPWFLGEEYTRGLAAFIAPSIPSLFSMLFNWKMRNVATPAVWEAGLVRSQQWPVVVFSHGLSANRSIYSTVCSELASHGFVVAAVEHRDSSACASFVLNEEGVREYILFKTLPPDMKEYDLRSQQIKVRVEESIRALDALHRLNEGRATNELPSSFDLQQLCGALDLTHPVMSGHSFGGVTAITTLATDKRFKIGLSLDPWMFPIKDQVAEICGNVTQPLICISTEAFQSDANLQAMNSLPPHTTTFVTIKNDTGHVYYEENEPQIVMGSYMFEPEYEVDEQVLAEPENQCDTPFLVGNIGRAFVGVYSLLDPHTAMDINNRLMLNFMAKHLDISPQHVRVCQGVAKGAGLPPQAQQRNMVSGLYGKGKGMLGWDKGYHSV